MTLTVERPLANTDPLVEVKGLKHVYGNGSGGPGLVVLEDVNLTMRPNEIVGLLGRSGSGKSTLLRSIAGLITPTAGSVTVSDMPGDSTAHGVSMVFQSFALFPWLTVLKNVELGLEAQGVTSVASALWRPSISSASTDLRMPIPRNSPGACVRGWVWPGPWWSSPPSC